MNTHRLSLDERLVAGILDYYEFDKTWLSNMYIDMEELYPKQYSILKRRKVLNNILKNQNRIQKIQDYIRRGFQYFRGMGDAARLKAIENDMQQEEIINQIKRSNYVDSDAIRAWYFRLHPKYTPLEIINYHHAAIEKMGREWFQKLTLWQQYEVEIKATQVYEFHQLNYKEKKKKMVYDLHEELLVLLGEKVLPQYCRLVMETMYIKKKSFIEDEVNEKEKRVTYKIKDDKITKVYDRLAKIESAYNNQVKVGIEQVVKEVFFAHSSIYAASDIRFWVREFFAENVDRDRPTSEVAICDEKDEPNVVPKIVVDRERKNCSHELGKTSCIFEPKILSYRDEACRLDNFEMKNEISRYSLEVVEKVRKEINDTLDRRKDHLIHDATAKHFSKILSECDEIHLKASCQIDRRFVTTPLEPPLPEKRELPRPNVAKYLPKSGSPTKTVDFPRRRFSKTTPPKRTDSGSTDRIQQETERPDSALRIGSISDSETNRPVTAAPMRRFSRMTRPPREKKNKPTDPGSADRRQQEAKSSGRSRPMRRLSSLTSSNSTEFWSTDKTQEETKSSGRMIPRRRPSTATTPKSTDPGPSPKLASGPTGIRRTLSFDKTVVQQSPKIAKNTSLDDELSDLTSPKSTDPGPSPKPASAPKTIEAKSPRKGIKRTLSTDKKVVQKSPKKTEDTSSDDEEDELPQKRL